ncbi:hypothetical protein Ae406Ps2_6483c [Pseudonocardia sp. Ae406_Ps2]|nr:hypothetical protein Ae406Ps2_6483c [Pseudonocardia sp. Ae406_Ps2]
MPSPAEGGRWSSCHNRSLTSSSRARPRRSGPASTSSTRPLPTGRTRTVPTPTTTRPRRWWSRWRRGTSASPRPSVTSLRPGRGGTRFRRRMPRPGPTRVPGTGPPAVTRWSAACTRR